MQGVSLKDLQGIVTPLDLNFHPIITDWFQRRYGAASPPQQQGWPAIAAGRHTLILSPTGSGKTLAAFLWSIDQLFRLSQEQSEAEFTKNSTGVHTLYISPLKALNNDIHYNLQEPLQGIRAAAAEQGLTPAPIRAALRTGDTTPSDRQKLLRRPPHILITTPESLYLLVTSLKGRELFRRLRYVIIDEIHSVCNNKRGVHLSLSLERLCRLADQEPQRIGLSATQRPLEKVAAFLGGQAEQPRPVTIVDCGRKRTMELAVISPVDTFSDLPEASVWPAVIRKLYDLIRSHRTTLIFVNMRAQAEKLSRQLNELHQQETGDANQEISQAHHGSISREMRYQVEAKLKQGDLAAVVATASLELGIDIGSIDLVVQVESPKSVSSALQRVGRSGHMLHAVGKGCMIPLYPADLDDCLAVTRAMLQADIEETVIPENCLDILAQQIVAEVAMESWQRRDLYALFRQSYCYRALSETAFNQTIEMLSGKYSDEPLTGLQPRLSWDRVNDQLIGRQGSRMLAVLNMGSIPDRGYYGVYLGDSRQKLGEVEEEFVFESRVGDSFFLGNNEWRIQKIDRNEIRVAAIQAIKPRPPFWKGESLFKSYDAARRIGRFRAETLAHADAESWLMQTCCCDLATAQNLLSYLHRQQESTGMVPTDTVIVVEQFQDASSIPHVVVHAPFGSRVMGAWAMVLSAMLEKEFGLEFQYAFDDDGLLFRFPDSVTPPDLQKYFSLDTAAAKQLLLQGLAASPIFSVRFRHNAARSLILPRSRPGKRIPLWLQRLRSADLLQTVRRYPDFPILVETFRDCLEDVFDWPTLQELLPRIAGREIAIHFAKTAVPSPMASGLMFRFLSGHLYEEDRLRISNQAAEVSNDLLAEVLRRDQLPAILTHELVQEAENRWQHLTPDTRARDQEELLTIIEKLGPLGLPELQERCRENPVAWLDRLHEERRILLNPEKGWSVAESINDHDPVKILLRFLQSHGPRTCPEMVQATGLDHQVVVSLLPELTSAHKLVSGLLHVDSPDVCWCHPDRFAELYRRAISRRRQWQQPADAAALLHALFTNPAQDPQALCIGFYLPLKSLERDLLVNESESESLIDLQDSIARGETVLVAGRNHENGRTLLSFWPAGRGHIFTNRHELDDKSAGLTENGRRVQQFLHENGASFPRVIGEATGLSLMQVLAALKELLYTGLASCDDYGNLLSILESEFQTETRPKTTSFPNRIKPTRSTVRQRVQQQQSRWFLLSSFSVLGREINATQQAEQQARLLLHRYGVVVKEAWRREQGLLSWPAIFHALKRLEWQGEIRRGYFVQGLSGIQFAMPEFLQRLQNPTRQETAMTLLATLHPFSALLSILIKNNLLNNSKNIDITRAGGNHFCIYQGRFIAYIENYGRRIQTTDFFQSDHGELLAEKTKVWLRLPDALRPRKRLELCQIDSQPAASHPLASAFLSCGYEKEGESLVLWPSGI